MRPDMHKVVTESPRRGSGNPSLKTGGKISTKAVVADEDGAVDADFGPTRAPVSRHRQHGWDAKEFSDLLGPLRRYLRKQVGRPWDTVYSELSASLDKRSLTGIHIWDHIRSDVEVHTYLGVDGQVWTKGRYGHPSPVGGWRGELYVHPVTRLLSYAKATPRPRRKKDVDTVKLTDTTWLQRIDGIWYHVTKATVTERVPATWRTFVYHGVETHHRSYMEAKTETTVVTYAKRQLGKKELKRYGLANTPTE